MSLWTSCWRPGEPTLANLLKKAGYATACIGKWGVGHPPPPDDPHRAGFDHFFGYLSMWHAHNFYPDFLWRDGEKVALQNIVEHPVKHYKENQAPLVGLRIGKSSCNPRTGGTPLNLASDKGCYVNFHPDGGISKTSEGLKVLWTAPVGIG